MGIGAHIQRELDRREWTPYKLAMEAGMLPQDVSKIIKKDSNPQIDTVLKIANGFGMTIDELIANPKPTPQIRGKPTGAKEVRQCLKDFGLDARDVKLAMSLIVQMGEAQKAKGKAATG
jgi:transcriptional regulator with XRE-family HTH domain